MRFRRLLALDLVRLTVFSLIVPRLMALSSLENKVRPNVLAVSISLAAHASSNLRENVRISEITRLLITRFFSSDLIFLIEFLRFATVIFSFKMHCSRRASFATGGLATSLNGAVF